MYFCDIRCKSEWQKTQHPVSNDWLRQKYEVEKLNCTQIAHIVGRDPKSVWNWIKSAGIQTRKRGEASMHKFVKGRKAVGMPQTEAQKEAMRQRSIADGRVPYLKNGVHWLKGKRGADTPMWKGGITPERQRLYTSPEWIAVAHAVWVRDGSKCCKCGLEHNSESKGRKKLDIHHIDAFSVKDRRLEMDNLALLCRKCHMWVHSAKNEKREFLGIGHKR
jgi:hypothetical protein